MGIGADGPRVPSGFSVWNQSEDYQLFLANGFRGKLMLEKSIRALMDQSESNTDETTRLTVFLD
jgi:hypothetical protein